MVGNRSGPWSPFLPTTWPWFEFVAGSDHQAELPYRRDTDDGSGPRLSDDALLVCKDFVQIQAWLELELIAQDLHA